MSDKVMTPRHPRWTEFAERLDRVLTLDGREEMFRRAAAEKGAELTEEEEAELVVVAVPSGCNGKEDRQRAHEGTRAILRVMGLDVERSVAFLRLHGGACDCEILWNVDDDEQDCCPGPPAGCEDCQRIKDSRVRWEREGRPGLFTKAEQEYLNALE